MYQRLFKLLVFSLVNCFILWAPFALASTSTGIVVLQTDFGTKDGAVSAVKGVMYSANRSLLVADLTNEITPFNIWEAAYRLYQAVPYWPKGTVFVSVVDPGVGTKRKSIVAESDNGYFFVTPDNGTLTLIQDNFGLKEVREIDESKNRLKDSNDSYTFHGRDVYGYVAARLAAGILPFSQVGPKLTSPIVTLAYEKPFIKDNKLYGTIAILDPQYGNLWTNIPASLIHQYRMEKGKKYRVTIYHHLDKKFSGVMFFQNTFGEVEPGKNLLYINSLMNLSIGTNQKNFSKTMHIDSGSNWRVEIQSIESQ